MKSRVYFAYGSNMDLGQMRERCPASTPVGVATLPRHAFRIAAGGYATVVPDPDQAVHGVLWSLATDDEAALDRYEDLEAGLYHKIEVVVTRPDGTSLSAMAYVATDPTVGRPVPEYQERIVEAAFHHRLPGAYIESLRTWLNAGQARP